MNARTRSGSLTPVALDAAAHVHRPGTGRPDRLGHVGGGQAAGQERLARDRADRSPGIGQRRSRRTGRLPWYPGGCGPRRASAGVVASLGRAGAVHVDRPARPAVRAARRMTRPRRRTAARSRDRRSRTGRPSRRPVARPRTPRPPTTAPDRRSARGRRPRSRRPRRRDVTMARRIEDEAQEVGAGVQRDGRLLERPDAADLDACHARRR